MTAFEKFMADLAYDDRSFFCVVDDGDFLLSSNVDGYAEEDGDFEIYEERGSLFDSY
jgi:hypothetical protein